MNDGLLATASTQNTSKITSSGEIIFEKVSKTFPGNATSAIDQVSFTINPGELVVLLGPSGCGKTTLLKLVNRLYEPDSGKIWIGENEIHTLPITALRKQIGYVIQQVGLFPHMDIHKNISVVPNLLGWDKPRIDERVDYLMNLIGLPKEYLIRYPRQLSGGEQQRVGLARALAADPEILLMDEPFAAVDAINRERLQNELLEIQDKLHKTILFVTHDVEEAFRLANQIIVMNSGKLVQYGTSLELVTNPKNEFIEELVGSNNILRKLSLLNVGSILKTRENRQKSDNYAPIPKNELPVIHPEDDLRSVISLLISSGSDVLPVNDPHGQAIGEVGYEDIRAMLISNLPANQKEQ